MSSLSKEQRTGEIAALRGKMKANPALHVELLAALTKTFRDHGIVIDKGVIPDLIVALPEEVSNTLAEVVVLPGGTNCGL